MLFFDRFRRNVAVLDEFGVIVVAFVGRGGQADHEIGSPNRSSTHRIPRKNGILKNMQAD